jgi:small subunit ribosomal protein S17
MSDEKNEKTTVVAEKRGDRKTRRGYVVSDKMQKTVVVEVEDRVKHPLYGKVIRRTSKVKAHDELGSAGVGDLVLIMETRPLSATKRWRLVEVLEKAKEAAPTPSCPRAAGSPRGGPAATCASRQLSVRPGCLREPQRRTRQTTGVGR